MAPIAGCCSLGGSTASLPGGQTAEPPLGPASGPSPLPRPQLRDGCGAARSPAATLASFLAPAGTRRVSPLAPCPVGHRCALTATSASEGSRVTKLPSAPLLESAAPAGCPPRGCTTGLPAPPRPVYRGFQAGRL